MRIVILLTLVFFQVWAVKGQTSLSEIYLNRGEYKVGYKHYEAIDSSRTYRIHNEFNNQFINRPIPISIWFPAKIDINSSKLLNVFDYLQIFKEEEE